MSTNSLSSLFSVHHIGGKMRTPWGPSQTVKEIGQGAFKVSCAGHGGLLIDSSLLSDAAKEFGEKCGKYIAFEEDCMWAVGAFDANLDFHKDHQLKTISLWVPEYLIKLGREDLLLQPEYEKYKERKALDDRRSKKDPDLIVAASMLPSGAVKVWTADDNIYLLDSDCGYTSANLNLDHYPHIGPLSKFACVSEVRKVKHLPDFAISSIDGTSISDSVNIKKAVKRLSARKTVLLIRKNLEAQFLLPLKGQVSLREKRWKSS